jgi:hypothetical protein
MIKLCSEHIRQKFDRKARSKLCAACVMLAGKSGALRVWRRSPKEHLQLNIYGSTKNIEKSPITMSTPSVTCERRRSDFVKCRGLITTHNIKQQGLVHFGLGSNSYLACGGVKVDQALLLKLCAASQGRSCNVLKINSC